MTPSTTLSWRVWVNSHAPAAPVRLPMRMKTTEKPSTKSTAPSTIRLRLASARSAPERPVAYDR